MKYNPSLVLSAYLALSVLSAQAADIASREETAFEIPKVNVFVPQRVGNQVTVNFDNREFSANIDGVTHRINQSDVSGFPRDLKEEQLKSFLSNGYLTLKSIGEDYGIEANARGLGGMWRNKVVGFIKDPIGTTKAEKDRVPQNMETARRNIEGFVEDPIGTTKREGVKTAIVGAVVLGNLAQGNVLGAVINGLDADEAVNEKRK